MADRSRKFNRDRQISEMFASLNRDRKSGQNTDVVLVCGETRFPAHKIVLMGFSPYFKSFFNSNFPDAREKEVTMQLDDDVMEILLDNIYDQDKSTDITDVQLAIRVLQAAHLLQMNNLFTECCEKIQELGKVNDFQFLASLTYYNDRSLTNMLKTLAKENCAEIFKEGIHLKYEFDEFMILVDLVHTSKFVTCETLMNAIANWIRNNERSLVENLDNFLKLAFDCDIYNPIVNLLKCLKSEEQLLFALELPTKCVANPNSIEELQRSLRILQFDDHGITQGVFRTWYSGNNVSSILCSFEYKQNVKVIANGGQVLMIDCHNCHCWYLQYETSKNHALLGSKLPIVASVDNLVFRKATMTSIDRKIEKLVIIEGILFIIEQRRGKITQVNYTSLSKDHMLWRRRRIQVANENVPYITFSLNDRLVFALLNFPSEGKVQFKTLNVDDFVRFEQFNSLLEPSVSKSFSLPFQITSENTVSFGNKLHSFHKDKVYVYDPQTESYDIRPSGLFVKANDAIYAIPEYKHSFSVLLRRQCSNKFYYKLWKVGQNKVTEEIAIDVDPSNLKPQLVILHKPSEDIFSDIVNIYDEMY